MSTHPRRDRPWSKDSPPGPWDDIVIGSGMGGMTTAATLAALGRRVLVLEQHYVPGGFTHVFNRPGYSWDVGVHAVGEVTRHSMPGRVLHHLTGGKLQWASLGFLTSVAIQPAAARPLGAAHASRAAPHLA